MAKVIKFFNKFVKYKKSHYNVVCNRFTIFLYDETSVASDEEQAGNILNLPGEMLVVIFKFLSLCDLRRCTLVCRKFRKLSFDSILWRRIFLDNMKINMITLERILNCDVRYLHLESSEISDQMTSIPPFSESTRFGSLQHLNVRGTRIKSVSLATLLMMTPQLKSIVLRSACNTIDNNILRILLNLEFLESLDIKEDLEIDHNILDAFKISRTLANLKYFRLSFCYIPKSIGILEKFLENLFKLTPNIVSLDLDNRISVKEDTLNHILNMKYIKYLSAAINCSVVNIMDRKTSTNRGVLYDLCKLHLIDESFRMSLQFLECAPNLRFIRLEGCFITEAVLIQMISFKHLQHLTCLCCHFESLQQIHGNFESLQSTLRTLHLWHCYDLSCNLLSTWLSNFIYLNHFIINHVNVNWAVFKSLLTLKYLKNLEMYNVRLLLPNESFIDPEDCTSSQLENFHLEPAEVSEIGPVLSFCFNITHLCLANCVITKYIIQCVIQMTNLESLIFSLVEQGSHDNMSDLSHVVLCKLTYFCFSYAEFQATPTVLESLLPAVNCAQSIRLKNCIITKTIYLCILKMVELDSLKLHFVPDVSSKFIRELLKNCSKLREENIEIKKKGFYSKNNFVGP